jgi:hypothetical protein
MGAVKPCWSEQLPLAADADRSAGERRPYNGVNLLNGNNLTVNFNEAGTSKLTITSVTFNSTGLGLSQIGKVPILRERTSYHRRAPTLRPSASISPFN